MRSGEDLGWWSRGELFPKLRGDRSHNHWACENHHAARSLRCHCALWHSLPHLQYGVASHHKLHTGTYNRMCFLEIVKKIAEYKAKGTPAAQSWKNQDQTLGQQ